MVRSEKEKNPSDSGSDIRIGRDLSMRFSRTEGYCICVFRHGTGSNGFAVGICHRRKNRVRRRFCTDGYGSFVGFSNESFNDAVWSFFGISFGNLDSDTKERKPKNKNTVCAISDSGSDFDTGNGSTGKWNMKEKEKTENGSITIESALIMPVVLYVIVLLVYLLLFLYNRNVCYDAALLSAKQAAYFESDTNRQIEKKMKEKCEEALLDRLVGVENLSVKISVSRFRTETEISARMCFLDAPVIKGLIPFGEIKVKGSAERFRPVDYFRAMKKVEYLSDWIKERRQNEYGGGIQEGYESQLPDYSSNMQLLPGPDDNTE